MDIFTKQNIMHGAGALLVIAVVAAVVGLYMFNTPRYPKFSYDTAAASGWWGSENINLQDVAGSNYSGDEPKEKLPVADMTVHHGEKGTSAPDDQCFTSFSYYDHPLGGLDAAYGDYENKKTEQGTLKAIKTVKETMPTFQGDKEYELRQYDFTIKDQDILSGYQVGFIELESGHMRVEGVCKTAEDLPLTLPILKSVRLLEN